MRRLTHLFMLGCMAAAVPLPAAAQAPLDTDAGLVTYFVAPGEPGSHFRREDRDLAVWALAAWERSANGVLRFEPASEESALVRVYWVPAGGGQYGEMRPLVVGGRRGAAVYIRPDTDALGEDIAELADSDPLFRDTIVYLTCVHELGHALGLRHTADFRDVMYFFGFGGDIPRFFERYRERLGERGDIERISGISSGDLRQLSALYGAGSATQASAAGAGEAVAAADGRDNERPRP
jgi:hypothetical protein